MIFRTFQNTDAESILALWNLAHPQYPLTADLMAKKIFLDPNFSADALLMGEEGGEMIAFAYLPHHKIKVDSNLPLNEREGFITYFSLHPDYMAAGKEFLETCEQYHRKAGRVKVSTAYAPLYHLQGFSEQYDQAYLKLFRSAGYKEYQSYRRRRTLFDYELPQNHAARKAALEQEGFYVGELPYNYLAEFAHSENAFSNGAWAWEFRSRLAHTPDLFRARVAIFEGKIVGGCIFGDPNSDEGRFGPFGMSPDFRGKGLGSVLFADCLNAMKARGIPSAWAQWTPLTGTAHYLYNKAGFLMEDCFFVFMKELN